MLLIDSNLAIDRNQAGSSYSGIRGEEERPRRYGIIVNREAKESVNVARKSGMEEDVEEDVGHEDVCDGYCALRKR